MPVMPESTMIEGLAAADVVDALTKTFGHRSHLIDLVSPDPTKVLFGPAVTVGFFPVRKDLMDPHRHSLGPAIYGALADRDPQGRVLVMSSGGYSDVSLGGSTKLSRVTNHGLAGVLCDGRLRDFDELADAPGAFYCRGEAIRAGGNLIQPFVTDTPIVVGGVTIVPGDVIFADTTGAAVIPADDVAMILELAHKIKAMAAHMAEMIQGEDPATVLRDGSKEV
jgi:4-hydroxy-4-methyl-2-oxoglutarate aldolase